MVTIQKFDRNTVKTLRVELEMAIANVCEKHGLMPASLGNIRFNDNSFSTSKLTFQTKTKMEKVLNSAPSDLLNKRFKMGQRIFTITTDNGNGTFNAKTNRGARYILRMDQIATMIQL